MDISKLTKKVKKTKEQKLQEKIKKSLKKELEEELKRKIEKDLKKNLEKEIKEKIKDELLQEQLKIQETNTVKFKDINIFDKIPSLTIKQICDLSCINIPEKLKKHKDLLINSETMEDLILLRNKQPMYVSKLKTRLKDFVEKYYTQDNLEKNNEDLVGYIVDWLYHRGVQGFSHNEYFDYELYNKTDEESETFLNFQYRNLITNVCNKKQDKEILKDKSKFNSTFNKYVQRKWVNTTTCTFEEFKNFVTAVPVHFAKIIGGTGAVGAGVREINETDNFEEIFEKYKKEKLIIEEIVKQHPKLAKFNESSLNTLRVYTLLCADGVARVLLANIRFGRKGNTVDNFHAGGVTAVVDVNKGVVSTDAINRSHVMFKTHPDSNLPIKGFKIPNWEGVVKTTTAAAKLIPTVRHIGWDVAINEQGEVELIEGNSWPNFDVTQTPDQIGKKEIYREYINELVYMKENNEEDEQEDDEDNS